MDLWPYINGKALVSGLNLKEMELSDMLDVLHFFFEDDQRFHSAEESQSVDSVRTSLYETIYGTKYKYKSGEKSRSSSSSAPYDSNEIKPYIPPTEFDPEVGLQFGSITESPLR